ncbi:MAG TPA: kelch repeat-containing protein [Solirubrobacteraceae bacterium]|nr:kelch repeat-containing protein [Solirubrobacteraceae bacterium]
MTPRPFHTSAAKAAVEANSPWTPLVHEPKWAAGAEQLLNNGDVLVQAGANGSPNWHLLTPDAYGNYADGKWTKVASTSALGYAPLYYGSAVLGDGKLIAQGGEYNFGKPTWTELGAIYDPNANTWTPVGPPSNWYTVGDAPSTVLANGTFMLGNCCSQQDALFNESQRSWRPTGAGKIDSDTNNEEGWSLLPNGQVLTVDVGVGATDPSVPTNSEVYTPSTGMWSSAGTVPHQLSNRPAYEMGPQPLMPNGTLFAIGATKYTALYNTTTGTWSSGPNQPIIGGKQYDAADAPATVLPNGNVLMADSPGTFNPPTRFFLFNGTSYTQVPQVPNAPTEPSYVGHFLNLPNGQIMWTDFTNQIELYTPSGSPNPSWAPTITSVPSTLQPGHNYQLSGTQLDGLDQGSYYGDDFQDPTNRPIVKITNGNLLYPDVTYAPATWTSDSIAPGAASTITFNVPLSTLPGPSTIQVVANGISSAPVNVNVP